MKRRVLFLAAALSVPLGASLAVAAPPAPIDPSLHSFPGSVVGTTSARSSGEAFADRWLGDEPFLNPALAPGRALSVSGLLQHVDRQDLHKADRQFTETTAFDGSGAWGAWTFRRLTLSAYGWQPVLRLEDNAYLRGAEGTPPAVVATTSTQREIRAGVGAAWNAGPAVVGLAGEWTRRDDSYDFTESAGVPVTGTDRVAFSGDGFGFAAGVRCSTSVLRGRGLTVGAAYHVVPSLDLTGTQTLRDSDPVPVAVTRGSSWEGGASARLEVHPSFSALASLDLRGAQSWDAFGVEAGSASQWSLGGEFHDPEIPWRLRFGAGMEQQRGVPEPRAGIYALGLGWRVDRNTAIDAAVVRRAIDRPGFATLYDDRVVATVDLHFQ